MYVCPSDFLSFAFMNIVIFVVLLCCLVPLHHFVCNNLAVNLCVELLNCLSVCLLNCLSFYLLNCLLICKSICSGVCQFIISVQSSALSCPSVMHTCFIYLLIQSHLYLSRWKIICLSVCLS